ncbi:hypothetical protein [Nostoc favosum]|uniref:Histidine kinase n=1 Tax=Nostoc favosum CHAB5714 TaxID=2780399 RepID=A0ABS8I743_9NOSO|nr:hypothetical protein [Nostoc favosum]MCC5599593.1 hypothetical protein [Nostoc favosum CHAB5714]
MRNSRDAIHRVCKEWGDEGDEGDEGTRRITHTQCPMPNAQCPMPHSQCPIPNAQCPFGEQS